MSLEIIVINGVAIPPCKFDIECDGAWLFSSLSYLIYGTDTLSRQVRANNLQHVSSNRERFGVFTMSRSGKVYQTEHDYLADMSKHNIYGTTCEFITAGEIFPHEFEVYCNGTLIATFGEALEGIKKHKFSGNLLEVQRKERF